MTKYIKQTVTKTHLNLEFDSNCSLCNLLGLYWDLFHDCDRDKRTFRHKLQKKKETTASNVPIVAIDVTTSLSLTGNRDWVLCIEYEVFI